jgi:hypothetical protein
MAGRTQREAHACPLPAGTSAAAVLVASEKTPATHYALAKTCPQGGVRINSRYLELQGLTLIEMLRHNINPILAFCLGPRLRLVESTAPADADGQ